MSYAQDSLLTRLPIFNIFEPQILQEEGGNGLKINIRKSALKKKRQTGFLKRMRTKGGRNIIKRRRARGREI
jgi:large subunit ribosomal protein L34